MFLGNDVGEVGRDYDFLVKVEIGLVFLFFIDFMGWEFFEVFFEIVVMVVFWFFWGGLLVLV